MRPARERFGLDGKTRATSIPAAVCKERATPPDGPKRSRPKGCFAFWPGLRCSSVTDHCGYAPSSRLGQTKNRSNAGHVGISTDSSGRPDKDGGRVRLDSPSSSWRWVALTFLRLSRHFFSRAVFEPISFRLPRIPRPPFSVSRLSPRLLTPPFSRFSFSALPQAQRLSGH